jgi:hypothetical protein
MVTSGNVIGFTGSVANITWDRKESLRGIFTKKKVAWDPLSALSASQRDPYAAVDHRKKVENHACAVALHAMYYNFVRIHQTLDL